MPKLEPMQPVPTGGRGRRARAMRVSTSLAEINVVPLVDVMLVLLVIFMVAAPMMTQGFPVDLPESRRSQAIDQTPIIVSIPMTYMQDGQIYLGEEPVPENLLPERIRQLRSDNPNRAVTLASDGDVLIRHAIAVMDRLIEAGVTSVNIQTQPVRGRRAP